MRHFALAFGLVSLTAGAAAAKPARPVDGAMVLPTSLISITSAESPADAHIRIRSAALVQCTSYSRATFLRVRASLRWDRRGKVARATVTSGSSAAFNRCARRALGGNLEGFPAGAPGPGAARVTFTIRKPALVMAPAPAPVPMPAPVPAPEATLQFCQADDDCTVYFQTMACVPSDPLAVNTHDLKAVSTAYPMRDVACGMGGPQYDELRMANEKRWSASCVKSRCTLQEHARPLLMKP